MLNERLKDNFLSCISIEGLSQKEKNVAAYVESFIRKLNLNYQIDDSAGITGSNTGNIICTVGKGGHIFLSCHMDTARSTKNVKPLFQNDRITSDGSTVLGVDNRAGMAVLLTLLEQLFLLCAKRQACWDRKV